MTKSDLTRRALRVTESVFKNSTLYLPEEMESYATGFEAGYRAARADLRRVLKAQPSDTSSRVRIFAAKLGVVWHWLKPIR